VLDLYLMVLNVDLTMLQISENGYKQIQD